MDFDDVTAINFSFLNVFSLKMEKEQVNNSEHKAINEQVLRNFHFFASVFLDFVENTFAERLTHI